MTIKLRIGNSLSAAHEAKGYIKNFRAGSRLPSEYSYKTLPLGKINPSYTGDKPITVDEVKRYFDRDDKHEPRMSTGVTMFANMTQKEPRWFSRPEDEHMSEDLSGAMRTYGESTIADESIGLHLNLYRLSEGHNYRTTQAYFDNAIFDVSNVLWEFSPDGGNGRWYQLYDLPNRAYTRVTLPKQTTRLRVRALSNSLDEWVQSFAVTPKSSYQKIGNEVNALGAITLTLDKYGYMKWNAIASGNGNIYYQVWEIRELSSEDTEEGSFTQNLIATTRDSHFQLTSIESSAGYAIMAMDEVGNTSISNIVAYSDSSRVVPNYHYLNYELAIKKGYATVNKSTGLITITGPGAGYTFGPRYNVTPALSELELNSEDIVSYDEATYTIELNAAIEVYSENGESDSTWTNDTLVTSETTTSSGSTINLDEATSQSQYDEGTILTGDSHIGHQINRLHIYEPE